MNLTDDIRAIPVVALAAVMLAGTPAAAHDPLKNEDGHRHENPQTVLHQHADLDLVRDLVDSFRATGDDRFLEAAWTIIEPAVGVRSPRPDSLVAAAFVAQARHDFDYALQLVRQALSVNGHYDEAWLLQASIHLVRGETSAAASACSQLREVPPLVRISCSARVALSGGGNEPALRRLQSLLAVVDVQQLPDEIVAWSHGVAGDLAASNGRVVEAVGHYRDSLALAERTQVRAALVDVLLDQGQFGEAAGVLDGGATALPLLVRKFIIARNLGRLDELQAELARVTSEFETWIAAEDWLHAREMARFFVDVVERPELARRLAGINASLQKEPEDLRLLRRTRSSSTVAGLIPEPDDAP